MGGSSKKQTVGYRYYLGLHMPICHGPIDKITRIRVADRIAWEGESTGGQLSINEPSLFGGDDREGGISGLVDLAFGGPNQQPNDYLISRQSADLGSAVGSGSFLYEIYNKFGTLLGLAYGNTASEAVIAYYPGTVQIDSETFIGNNEDDEPQYHVTGFWASGFLGFYIDSTVVEVEYTGIPAYRGITAAILRQVYLGNNPYLKPWEFRAQRIHTSTRGATQWYDEKSEVRDSSTEDGPSIVYQQTYTTGIGQDTILGDDIFDFSNGVAATDTTGYSPSYVVTLGAVRSPDFDVDVIQISFDFKIVDVQSGNAAQLNIFNSQGSNVCSFQPIAPSSGGSNPDPSRRCFFEIPGDVYFLGSDQLNTDEQYSGLISISLINETVSFELRDVSGDLVDSVTFNVSGVGPARYYLFGHSDSIISGITSIEYDNFILSGYQSTGDMNPAHIIRECLTDNNWGLGYTDADIDDTSFTAAADTLFDEEFGLSFLWSKEEKIQEFIKDILRHIDATLYVHPRTGLFTLKLIRDDYELASLPIFDESNIISISDYKKPTIGELTNYVTVQYWDRDKSEDSVVGVQDIALAQQQGTIASANVPFNGVTRGALANRLASRTLKELSNPLITATVITNREGASLNIGDAFKLTWPKFGLTETVMRVSALSFGSLTDGQVKIECVQDTFGLPDATFSDPTDSHFTDVVNAPANSPHRIVQESNYWTLIQNQGESFEIEPLDGYLITAATQPSADAISYRFWTDESGDYEEKEQADFCPTATINHDFPKSIGGVIQETIDISGLVADDLDDIDIGSIVQINDELMEVVSVSTTSLTVGRAVADSAIQDHAAGDRLFFWGNDFYGFSSTLYQDSDLINVKITPFTGLGQLDVDDATALPLTFDQRAYRAWNPGNLTLDGVYFPEAIEGTLTVDSAWAHRDRTLQTAGLNDFTEGSIGPEVGTTYTTTLTRVDTGTTVGGSSGISGTSSSDASSYEGAVRFEIKSVRDSLDSFYSQSHEFLLTNTEGLQSENNEFLLTETGEYFITES